MPTDLLARRVQLPGDLSKPVRELGPDPQAPSWTAEQLEAIERRRGELLLDAGAGSGKTSVLVERFARAVLEDGVEVGAILAITFTEKAAAELRERIRKRLRELGADDAARATEAAFISTIHGFCARVLRANALSAGIDPGFDVLDEQQSQRLADAAFDDALERLARTEADAIDLIAAYNPGGLRGATLALHGELRSRGQTAPQLPALPNGPDLDAARIELLDAAARAAAELGAQPDPSPKVSQALERLERLPAIVSAEAPWPGEVARLCLPGGNGAALSTQVCLAYAAALDRFKLACEFVRVWEVHRLLARLLELFVEAYAARKRAASALDFADLELMTRDLLAGDAELRERYRSRFAHVMVDELQDTNGVQFELIGQVAGENVFMVGDAQQSIYGFRHADVELFEALGDRLQARGARARLTANFRSRSEILEVIGQVFAPHGFLAPVPGRGDSPGHEPLVELLIADKASDWAAEGITAPWRVAEARALARRVEELIEAGAAPRDFVLLTRATTDLRAYERALEERGVPTYVIGGRGYWAHPQVIDVVSYLRALANPRDEEALYTLLASPMVALSIDALVILAAAGRAARRDPWWVLREPEGTLDELAGDDARRIAEFVPWFAAERTAAARLSVEELIDRALERTGYDLAVLAMPGGRRRLANIRKLMRLAREQEATAGRDLRAFLELVRGREAGWAGFGDGRESEAPVEGEALDAVRLMTIHRSKGLEFPIVCLADLGRQPWRRAETIRLGRDGRFGIRLAEPGTGKREAALDYEALGEEQQAGEELEERRLFYVAMTRAQERLIVSGAAKLEAWESERSPMGWIGPALIEAGVEPVYVVAGEDEDDASDGGAREPGSGAAAPADEPLPVVPAPPPPAQAAPAVSHLSYSSLGEYARCGYRFYVERVLGVPGAESASFTAGATRAGGAAGIGATERGILVHALLEKLDFRRPVIPPPRAIIEASEWPLSFQEAEAVAELLSAFATSELCARLGRATDARREQRFSYLLEDEVMITGALDVLAREPGGSMLVVDYKSDRLEGRDPAIVVASQYRVQRLIYALAALRAGADAVEVAHVFLEDAQRPVSAHFAAADAAELELELARFSGGVRRRDFRVTDVPHRAICNGCPAEGGLCSWPIELTRREAPDQLF
jgi:ATP-dependent exoDNAse (exonuclease V) beta subunit